MLFDRNHLLIPSILAVAALHCGGSARPSNTPEASTSGTATSGDTASAASTEAGSSGMSNAANTSDAAPENSGAHASMNLNDQQIAKVTEGVNSAEIEQARLAQSTTSNDQVRQFAAMMIEQHSQARQQQSALNLSVEDSPLSQRLSKQSQSTLDALRSKQGAEFDRAYLQAQVAAHQQVLEAIRNELRPNAQNPQLQTYLQQLEPQVAQHLEHARQAQQALQSSVTSDRSAGTARSD